MPFTITDELRAFIHTLVKSDGTIIKQYWADSSRNLNLEKNFGIKKLGLTPEHNITYAGKNVQQIRWLYDPTDPFHAHLYELKFIDGSKLITHCKKTIMTDTDALSDLASLFVLMNEHAIKDYAFSAVDQRRADELWDYFNTDTIYDLGKDDNQSETPFYNNILYPKLIALIKNRLQKQLDTPLHTLLVSAGCGTAGDLAAINANLEIKQLTQLASAGFDSLRDNINLARKKIPEGYFYPQDLGQTAQVLTQIDQEFNAQYPDVSPYKILIFSGVLARSVIDGTQAAVNYLHQAYSWPNLIIIGSYTAALVNPRILKAIGFHIRARSILHAHDNAPVLAITRQTEKERVTYLIARANKRRSAPSQPPQLLDLSMSADPCQDISYLAKTQNLNHFTYIDFSWSHLEKADELLQLIDTHLPKVSKLISTSQELGAQKFCFKTSGRFTLFYRANNPHEVEPLSITTQRRLGLMPTGLPVQEFVYTPGVALSR